MADTEARLKNDIRQKQQKAFQKIGAVEQQAEHRSAESSHRLDVLDLRMIRVQDGLGETDQAVNALQGRSDSTNKDIAVTQESLQTIQGASWL